MAMVSPQRHQRRQRRHTRVKPRVGVAVTPDVLCQATEDMKQFSASDVVRRRRVFKASTTSESDDYALRFLIQTMSFDFDEWEKIRRLMIAETQIRIDKDCRDL